MSAYLPCIFERNHIFYNKKNGTPLIRTPMGHATVSVLSGLILEKVYEFFFSAVKNETVRYIQESVLRGCP